MTSIRCEVCGTNIPTEPIVVDIDGAVLSVCSKCAKLGKPVGQTTANNWKGTTVPKNVLSSHTQIFAADDELVVREDFATVLRNARETMHLTQEQVGMKVNEKSSVIAKLESGKMKPSIALAKKLEHVMKVRLLERREL
ncbi:MAG: multiprotein bridging factor aMBF1 [Conexivisphaerales archaeon]